MLHWHSIPVVVIVPCVDTRIRPVVQHNNKKKIRLDSVEPLLPVGATPWLQSCTRFGRMSRTHSSTPLTDCRPFSENNGTKVCLNMLTCNFRLVFSLLPSQVLWDIFCIATTLLVRIVEFCGNERPDWLVGKKLWSL